MSYQQSPRDFGHNEFALTYARSGETRRDMDALAAHLGWVADDAPQGRTMWAGRAGHSGEDPPGAFRGRQAREAGQA